MNLCVRLDERGHWWLLWWNHLHTRAAHAFDKLIPYFVSRKIGASLKGIFRKSLFYLKLKLLFLISQNASHHHQYSNSLFLYTHLSTQVLQLFNPKALHIIHLLLYQDYFHFKPKAHILIKYLSFYCHFQSHKLKLCKQLCSLNTYLFISLSQISDIDTQAFFYSNSHFVDSYLVLIMFLMYQKHLLVFLIRLSTLFYHIMHFHIFLVPHLSYYNINLSFFHKLLSYLHIYW